MKITKDFWYVHTDNNSNCQSDVDRIAVKKHYDIYTESDMGLVYFTKRKNARKVARKLNLDPNIYVHNTKLCFLLE